VLLDTGCLIALESNNQQYFEIVRKRRGFLPPPADLGKLSLALSLRFALRVRFSLLQSPRLISTPCGGFLLLISIHIFCEDF